MEEKAAVRRMRGDTKDLNREIETRKKKMLELINTISETKYTLDHFNRD